jgi:hypothetical protein
VLAEAEVVGAAWASPVGVEGEVVEEAAVEVGAAEVSVPQRENILTSRR